MWSYVTQFPLETTVGRAALVGLALGLCGYLTLLATAFKESRGWGLLLLLFPPAATSYSIRNWDDTRKSALAILLALGMISPWVGDVVRQERDRRLASSKLGPEIFEDKETMAEMELTRDGNALLADAIGKRGDLYSDLGQVDELSPAARRPAPAPLHPDIPPDLDTLEKQAAYGKVLAQEQAGLEARRKALQPGDTAGIATLRADVNTYNARATRHRKAVEALRFLNHQPGAPPKSGPVAAKP
jgi:hypothetical protein